MKLPGPFSDTLHSPWSVVAWISYCRVSSGDATQNNNYNTYLSLLFTHKNTGGFMWLNKIFNISIAYFLFDTFAYRSRNTAFSFRYWQLIMCYASPPTFRNTLSVSLYSPIPVRKTTISCRILINGRIKFPYL